MHRIILVVLGAWTHDGSSFVAAELVNRGPTPALVLPWWPVLVEGEVSNSSAEGHGSPYRLRAIPPTVVAPRPDCRLRVDVKGEWGPIPPGGRRPFLLTIAHDHKGHSTKPMFGRLSLSSFGLAATATLPPSETTVPTLRFDGPSSPPKEESPWGGSSFRVLGGNEWSDSVRLPDAELVEGTTYEASFSYLIAWGGSDQPMFRTSYYREAPHSSSWRFLSSEQWKLGKGPGWGEFRERLKVPEGANAMGAYFTFGGEIGEAWIQNLTISPVGRFPTHRGP